MGFRVFGVEGLGSKYPILGTWDWGNCNCSTGVGEVYDDWVLGPLSRFHSPY